MLSESGLLDLFVLHALKQATCDYIQEIRKSEPSRLVGEHAVGNVCVHLQSRKMARSIACESHTAEYAFALEFEYSDDVFEYWNQPLKRYIRRLLANQLRRNELYTPDFFVISKAGFIVVEIKTAEEFEALQAKYPEDWTHDEEGYHYLPAEAAFREIGLKHVVLTTASLSKIRAPNLKLLMQARNARCDVISIADAKEAFGDAPFLTLATLSDRLGTIDRTPILKLIDHESLFCRISTDLLSRADTCWVSLSPSSLALVPKDNQLVIPNVDGVSVKAPSDKALARYALRKENLHRKEHRSSRRWRGSVRAGAANDRSEFDALMPDFDKCGNWNAKILPIQIYFLKSFYKSDLASPLRLSSRQAYRLYQVKAEIEHPGIRPVSYTTYRKRLRNEDPKQIAYGRGGRRAANKATLPTDVRDRAIKATRPYEAGSMDHYRANVEIELGEHNGKTYTACPWITGLVDLFDGSILAVWASVQEPSSKSCAMLFRRCIRIHARLPEIIVVDRGSDFRSVFFMSTLARKGVDIKQRPAGDPKYGSEIERLFGRFQERWLAFLNGNFANQYEARGVSRSHSPKETADMRLENFWEKLLGYEEFHNANSMTLGEDSPMQLRRSGLAHYSCSGIAISESPEFLIDTAIRLPDYSIEDNGCIRTREQRFYTECPLEMRSVKKKPPVHADPENPHILYVHLNGRWIVAYTSNAPLFESLGSTAKYAQSIRIGECVNIQREMRNDVERAFIREHILPSSKAMPLVQVPLDLPLAIPRLEAPKNKFDEVRTRSIDSITTQPTGVMKYVMGKNSK